MQNRILRYLPPHVFAKLQPHLRRVELKRGQILQQSHHSIESAYFIERGMAVILARTKQDGRVGVAVVGCQELVGVSAVLGTMQSPHHCVMEVKGEALQIGADVLRRAMDESRLLRQCLMGYVHTLLVQESQTVLCNARHQLMERLTRSLLLAHDRMDGDTIPLTHDLLSMMLGVRRAGITTALQRLECNGAVQKSRGAIKIANRTILEREACECYRIIATEYQHMVDFAKQLPAA
jgi:CRP-like cAMP-binding protein